MAEKSIIVHNKWALGDTVCLSAAIRDLQLAHPGRFRVSMTGHYLSHWNNLPYVSPLDPVRKSTVLSVDYHPGIVASNRGEFRKHFLAWFHGWLGGRLGVEVPATLPHGDIRFSGAESGRVATGRYWVVVAGGKTDMTAKWWPHSRYQAVVDRLAALGVRCVQAGAHFDRHVHRPLENCASAVGATDSIRDLYALIRDAEGVVCGVTGAMHVAAALGRPCVVLAGGREEWWWEAYTNHGQFPDGCGPVAVPHRFLHTLGALPCCRESGCWKNRTVPIERSDTATERGLDGLCKDPVRGDEPTPRCLSMIETDHVVEAVMGYYEDGTLPPIGPPTRKYADAPLPVVRPAEAVEVLPPPGGVPNRPPAELPATGAEDPAFRVLDHPTIGGRITIFLLCHGDHADLARRSFGSIFDAVPAGRADFRVALNQPCAETESYFRRLEGGAVTKVYADRGARRKYRAMRDMFWDDGCPIATSYVAWFDDDTKVIDRFWLVRLAETIIANHREGSRLYGPKHYHDLAAYAKDGHRPDAWFREASWWKDRPLHVSGRLGSLAPNGSCVAFAAGWSWALATETIRRADIPDARLNHNGGDITIGAQVHQAGFKVKDFNAGKRYVWCPRKEEGGRRGFSEAFPWADPETRARHVEGS